MNNQIRRVLKRVEKPVHHIGIEGLDFPLGKAEPEFAAGIDAQIDRDDAGDDFIKEKLHPSIRSSRTMTRPYDSSIGRVTAVMAFAVPGLSVAGLGVGSIAGATAATVSGSPGSCNSRLRGPTFFVISDMPRIDQSVLQVLPG
jgi:hypothetical protein